MSRPEEKSLRGWSGLKIMVASLVAGLAGTIPLLLYIVFGPRDGNPIGLGLLAMAVLPLAVAGAVAGFARMVIERAKNDKE